MPQSRRRRTGAVLATLTVAFACVPLADGAARELLRGGLQVRATPEGLEAAGATAPNPALSVPTQPVRKSASDPGAELRTQGALRRDAFRLLLGTD
jgi:hypothetical protein